MQNATFYRLDLVVRKVIDSEEYTTTREFETLTNSKIETLTAYFAIYPELQIKYLQNKRRNHILKNKHRIEGVQVRIRAGEKVQDACRKEGIGQRTYYSYLRDYHRLVKAA